MTSMSTAPAARFERFRASERAVWQSFGVDPMERHIETASGLSVRLNDVGGGDSVVFIHGSGGSGVYWAPLVAGLSAGLRCIAIDRPGWGDSTPIGWSSGSFADHAAGLTQGILDALGLERAHLVGGSIGALFIQRFAQRHPDRVGKVVLLGGGPFLPQLKPPTPIRLLRSPIGRLMVTLPQRPPMIRTQLGRLGHRKGLEAGLVPDALVQAYASCANHTDALGHERSLIRSVLTRSGFVDGFLLNETDLVRISAPTLSIYGGDDPVGSEALWEEYVRLSPNAALHIVPDTGHLPWFDHPTEVAEEVRRHLIS